MARLLFVPALACALAAVSCGSSSNKSTSTLNDASVGDTGLGEDAGSDATESEAASGYPAFPIDLPQVDKNQGIVLTNPVVVTVSWPGDSNAATWEAFGDTIGASSYWSSTTAQYGVSAVTSGASNHVRMNEPLPATLSYTDLQSYVLATLQDLASDAGAPDADAADAGGAEGGGPNPPWPRPTIGADGTSQTIYALFIAPSTSVTDPGSMQPFCVEGGLGYHDNVVVGTTSVAYSVTLECPGLTNPEIEETAAHETVEAATNPFPESTSQGYINFDADHLAWDLYSGFDQELADACQNWQDSYYQETGDFPYWVQRSWSNAAAVLGAAPCVPAAATPYYGMTLFPAQESTVQVNLTAEGFANETTKGFLVTVGQAFTFQVGYVSEASVPAWKINYDFPTETQLTTSTGRSIGNGTATVSIDKATGQNGDQANVTVTIKTKGQAGFHIMAITWDPPTTNGYLPKYLPVLLVDQ